MTALSRVQIDQFWNDGVLTVENAVAPELLSRLRPPEFPAGASFFVQQVRQREEASQ